MVLAVALAPVDEREASVPVVQSGATSLALPVPFTNTSDLSCRDPDSNEIATVSSGLILRVLQSIWALAVMGAADTEALPSSNKAAAAQRPVEISCW